MNLDEFEKKLRSLPGLTEAFAQLDDDLAFQTSNLVEEIRLDRGLTQAQFAEQVGVQQSAIARMERGRIIPTLSSLQRIAKAFDLTLKVSMEPKRAKGKSHSRPIASSPAGKPASALSQTA